MTNSKCFKMTEFFLSHWETFYRQSTYIVGKLYKMYLYELQKQEVKEAFGEFIFPVCSECKWVLYFQTMYVFFIVFFHAMSKSPTKLTNSLKRNRNNRRSNRFQCCPLPRPCLYSAVSNHHYTWIKYQKSNILVSDRI